MTIVEQSKPEDTVAVVSESSLDVREGSTDGNVAAPKAFKPTGRFWAIIFTCATIGLLSALENTVVTTALPQISTELDLGTDYVWVTNIFFLTGSEHSSFSARLL
jgi:hypothetical protein